MLRIAFCRFSSEETARNVGEDMKKTSTRDYQRSMKGLHGHDPERRKQAGLRSLKQALPQGICKFQSWTGLSLSTAQEEQR